MKRRTVRRVACVGVALTVVALAMGVTVGLLEPPPGVTEANVRRIRLGMTLAEVEAVLGNPPDYCEDETEEVTCATWSGEEGDVDVTFDEKDRVDWVGFTPSRASSPGPLDRLRSLFGW